MIADMFVIKNLMQQQLSYLSDEEIWAFLTVLAHNIIFLY